MTSLHDDERKIAAERLLDENIRLNERILESLAATAKALENTICNRRVHEDVTRPYYERRAAHR